MRRGKPFNEAKLRFPAEDLELKFATTRFRTPGLNTCIAEFFLVRGFFFSIVFDRPIEAFQRRTDIQVLEVTIHYDLMQEGGRTDHKPAVGSTGLSGWVKEWAESFGVESAGTPLESAARDRRISSISTKLPEDYLFLTTQAEALTIGDCAVLGLSEIYEVVLEGSSYYLLAQLDGRGVLAVRSHTDNREVYYLDYSDSALVKKVSGFRRAVESYVKDREHWLEGAMMET